MARVPKGSFTEGISGAIGKQLVYKQYDDKTVVTKFPDMSRVKASRLQQIGRDIFKEAVKYAKLIVRNKEAKEAYAAKLPKGKSVYHAALKEYMAKKGKL